MQAQAGVALGGIVEQADVGKDHCIHAQSGGTIDGALPVGHAAGLGEGVDRHQHLAAARLRVADAFAQGLVVEVEPGEIARVGVVPVAEVDRISAVVDCRLQGGQAAGWADELGNIVVPHGGLPGAKVASIATPACGLLISVNVL